jgi:hypothetical protein
VVRGAVGPVGGPVRTADHSDVGGETHLLTAGAGEVTVLTDNGLRPPVLRSLVDGSRWRDRVHAASDDREPEHPQPHRGWTRRVVADRGGRRLSLHDGRRHSAGPRLHRAMGAREESGTRGSTRGRRSSASRRRGCPVTRHPRAGHGRCSSRRSLRGSATEGGSRGPRVDPTAGALAATAVPAPVCRSPVGGPGREGPSRQADKDRRARAAGRRRRCRWDRSPCARATTSRVAASPAPTRASVRPPARPQPGSPAAAFRRRRGAFTTLVIGHPWGPAEGE